SGTLPPRPADVASAQMLCGPPTVAVVGSSSMVTVTSAAELPHVLVMVHLSTTGPVPLVCVNVAAGVPASGLNVPVPPLTTDQAPVPLTGALPPRPAVVPSVQMVCGPPAVAVVGGSTTVKLTSALEDPHVFEIVHRTMTGPVPPVCVN